MPPWTRLKKRPNLPIGPHKSDRVAHTIIADCITVARSNTLQSGRPKRVVHEGNGTAFVLEFICNVGKVGLVILPVIRPLPCGCKARRPRCHDFRNNPLAHRSAAARGSISTVPFVLIGLLGQTHLSLHSSQDLHHVFSMGIKSHLSAGQVDIMFLMRTWMAAAGLPTRRLGIASYPPRPAGRPLGPAVHGAFQGA